MRLIEKERQGDSTPPLRAVEDLVEIEDDNED